MTVVGVMVGAALFLGGFVQYSMGFGGGMVALQLLLLFELPLPESITYTIVMTGTVCILMGYRMSATIEFQLLRPLAVLIVLSMPLGFLVQSWLVQREQDLVRMCIGSIILRFLCAQWVFRVRPRSVLHRKWGALAAVVSGILAGFANMGGPPVALWVHAHRWTNERIRGTLAVLLVVSIPFQLIFAVLAYGGRAVSTVWEATLILPVFLAGGWIGSFVGRRIPVKVLRAFTYVLLIALSVSPIVKYLTR